MQKAQTVQVQGPVGDQRLTASPLRRFVVIAVAFVLPVLGDTATADQTSQALRVEGARQLYNLDLEAARETFRKAVAADPADSAAHLAAAWAT